MELGKLSINFIFAILSTVGFSLISNIPRRIIPAAAFTGAVAWLVYYLLQGDGKTAILSNFFAAFTIGLIGNLLAMKIKVAVNMIYIPSLISLVPGSIMFLGMKNVTNGNAATGTDQLLRGIEIAMALAVGFVCAEVVFNSIRKMINGIR